MRIATWNINNVNLRLPLLLAWLDATKPDAIAADVRQVIQEKKKVTRKCDLLRCSASMQRM